MHCYFEYIKPITVVIGCSSKVAANKLETSDKYNKLK